MFSFPAFKRFFENIDFLEFLGISTLPAHISWHSRKVKILARTGPTVIRKNLIGQVAGTSRLLRRSLGVRAV